MGNFDKYITLHSARKITVGQSGAQVFELDNDRIAKRVSKKCLADDSLWESYVREYRFYSALSPKAYGFLPEIFHCQLVGEEIQLIMKRYTPLQRSNLDDKLLEKIFATLGEIHRLPLPDFLPRPSKELLHLSNPELETSLKGWLAVLKEHEPAFAKEDLYRVADHINEINRKFHSTKSWCCHGDFHYENLLLRDDGSIVVCDWQSVSSGHAAGDISFFLSRLAADGFLLDRERAVRTYCRVSGTGVSPEEIQEQMSLANLNTSFVHWHHYLHGCSQKRVADIFLSMTADGDYLLNL